MSHGTGLGQERYQERDFVLSTTEEFVKKFNGTRAITKVSTPAGKFSGGIAIPKLLTDLFELHAAWRELVSKCDANCVSTRVILAHLAN